VPLATTACLVFDHAYPKRPSVKHFTRFRINVVDPPASEAGYRFIDVSVILDAVVREPALYKVPGRRALED
jgi:hypothetical protein